MPQYCWVVAAVLWRNMSVNLSKNGAALMAAYEEVVSGKSNTDW